MMERFREPVNGFTHLAGAVLGALGLVLLVSLTHDDTAKMISIIVYGISMIVLYLASTTFHLVKGSERVVFFLRRVDHAAIYVMIAGTYTPILYNVLNGTWRWGLLILVWTLAVVGIIYKLAFLRGNRNHLSTFLYVCMGWLGVLVFPKALELMQPGAVALIVGGGVVYSLGAIIFALERPNLHRYFGHHELWHIFVLAGSALHYLAILLYII